MENCIHIQKVTKMIEGSGHKYKVECEKCKKFIGWNTKEYTKDRVALIETLTPYLSKWETEFCKSIANRPILTEKQEKRWEQIIADYKEVGVIN